MSLESLFLYQRIPSLNKHFCAAGWRDTGAFTAYSLQPGLHQNTENCLVQSPRKLSPSSSRLWDEGREERTILNLGIRGSRGVELECLNNEAATGSVPGVWACSHVLLLQHTCLPSDQLETCGLVTMGIDGCCWQRERKVLGIDSKIIGEQRFSPSLWLPCLLLLHLIN